MIAACYSMDLYCRNLMPTRGTAPRTGHYGPRLAQYTGETFGECKRQAQRDGWVFNKDGDVTCPKCAKRT